jgi:hypothetical protein
MQARAKWMECLDYLQPGNVLLVADLTKLGRSTADLANIVTVLGQPGDRVPVPGRVRTFQVVRKDKGRTGRGEGPRPAGWPAAHNDGGEA